MQDLSFEQPMHRFRALVHSLAVTLRVLVASSLCLLAVNTAVANPQAPGTDTASQVVNINSADAPTLAERLVGIGLSRAEAIVAYRDAHGKFQDPYELVAVKGVGEATVAKNESRIRLRD